MAPRTTGGASMRRPFVWRLLHPSNETEREERPQYRDAGKDKHAKAGRSVRRRRIDQADPTPQEHGRKESAACEVQLGCGDEGLCSSKGHERPILHRRLDASREGRVTGSVKPGHGRGISTEGRRLRRSETDAMNLDNRTVVITGGKRIGRVVARELAVRGADLILSYRGSRSEAEETTRDVTGLGRRAIAVAADVSKSGDCEALMATALGAFGRIDALVNMASIYGSKDFDALTEADWDKDLSVNLKSAFLCARAAIPSMRAGGGGRIVNFADWLARSGRPAYHGFLSYYVAKAGVIALTEALALELAAHQILVNAIAPGPILAPPDMAPEEVAAVARATPVGRWGGEIEIARAVIALIETDFITGETIRVDGGRHLG
jgi:NAD(P)-dependent dehydrogenase (short-subunit alcohol dehydrogenase family)